MYCGCARTSLDMNGRLDFDSYSLGGIAFLVLFFSFDLRGLFFVCNGNKVASYPFFIEGVDIVVQRSECTVDVQGRL